MRPDTLAAEASRRDFLRLRVATQGECPEDGKRRACKGQSNQSTACTVTANATAWLIGGPYAAKPWAAK